MKTVLTLTLAATLAVSATSAFAASLADTINARPAAEATAGLHLSLGGKAFAPAKPVYGASLGIRAGGQPVSQALNTPAAKVAEFNISDGKVQDARVGAVNFAPSEANVSDDRLGFSSSGKTALWLWVALGVGVAWYLIDQNNSDGHSSY